MHWYELISYNSRRPANYIVLRCCQVVFSAFSADGHQITEGYSTELKLEIIRERTDNWLGIEALKVTKRKPNCMLQLAAFHCRTVFVRSIKLSDNRSRETNQLFRTLLSRSQIQSGIRQDSCLVPRAAKESCNHDGGGRKMEVGKWIQDLRLCKFVGWRKVPPSIP